MLSSWVRPYVAPETVPEELSLCLDGLEVHLETLASEITNAYVATGCDFTVARQHSLNLITHAALLIQRRYAPEAQKAMFEAHLVGDPNLGELRNAILIAAAGRFSPWRRLRRFLGGG